MQSLKQQLLLEELETTVTRIEIIDEEWRRYVKRNTNIKISIQDDWNTMNIFAYDKKE